MSEARCQVCGGAPEEHSPGKTQHAFTEVGGQLLTHEQVAEAKRRREQAPQVIRLPGAQTNEATAVARLVEVLLEKRIMTTDEALYVAGMAGKPHSAEAHYRDPNREMGG